MAKKIMILGFGGTIAMVPGPKGLQPAKNIEEILAMVPSLREMADVSFEEIENQDSTDINPSHWTKLAFRLAEIQDEYDGVLVTHGTDTMAYTAGALALAMGRGLRIPVIFTGSQLPLVEFATDGVFNLENAMKTVLQAVEASIAEVMIVFLNRVMRGSRTIKTSEADFMAFDSPAFPHLARITAVEHLRFIPDVLTRETSTVLDLQPHFQRGILTVDLVPGLEPGLLMGVIDSGKCQGMLFKSLGSGNVPGLEEYSLIPVIARAVEHKIPVLVATKFVGGQTIMTEYKAGQRALDAGAIPAGDMTDVMAQVKMMWCLAQGFRSREEFEAAIGTDYVGEITV